MKDKGVGDDDVNLTFYYGPNTSLLIGNYTVPKFKQGQENSPERELVETRGLPWEAAYTAVSNAAVIFRVGLATKVKCKILFWYIKRHKMMVGVNGKGIKLKSTAPEHGRYLAPNTGGPHHRPVSTNPTRLAETSNSDREDEGKRNRNVTADGKRLLRGKSCKGCLFYSSVLNSKSQRPLCIGLSD